MLHRDSSLQLYQKTVGGLSGGVLLRHFIQRYALWRQADYRLRSLMCLMTASCSFVALLATSWVALTFKTRGWPYRSRAEIPIYQLVRQNYKDLPRTDLSRPPEEKDIRETELKATAQSNFVGLTEFLQLARLLESLEIHYYRLNTARHFLGDQYAPHERLLKQVARSEKLPKLKQCRLRGIDINEETYWPLFSEQLPAACSWRT